VRTLVLHCCLHVVNLISTGVVGTCNLCSMAVPNNIIHTVFNILYTHIILIIWLYNSLLFKSNSEMATQSRVPATDIVQNIMYDILLSTVCANQTNRYNFPLLSIDNNYCMRTILAYLLTVLVPSVLRTSALYIFYNILCWLLLHLFRKS